MGGLGKEESKRNQIWRNFVAHFHDFVAIVFYIYNVNEREWGGGNVNERKTIRGPE